MTRPARFWLAGEGLLLIACAGVLLSRGHRVTGVAGPEGPARSWAEDHGIPGSQRVRHLTGPRPDFLLSIVNPHVLNPAELAAPARLAVNFHSSPLPRYAGVHSTAWAVLNGETEYGVTWHVMAEEVDSGDILVQRRFPLDEDETALSLGVKCYHHGLDSFTALIDALEKDRLAPLKQDAGRRSYYTRRDRMPGAGLIGAHHTGQEVARWCRAAHVGNADNAFGLPKLLAGGTAVVLDEVAVRPTRDTARPDRPPGTRVPAPGDAVAIATAGADLLVTRVRRLDGTLVAAREWAAGLNFHEGDRLALPTPEICRTAGAIDRAHCVREAHWAAALAAARPLPPELTARPAHAPRTQHHIPLPDRAGVSACTEAGRRDLLIRLAAGWIAHAARRGGTAQTIWWSTPAVRAAAAPLPELFATAVPVTTDTPAPALAEAVRAAERRGTFARDLPLRRPGLAALPSIGDGLLFALDTDGFRRLCPEPRAMVCLDAPGERLHLLTPDPAMADTLAAILRSYCAPASTNRRE
ncbi:formyltransferase family protein [Streptomyces syringium]|uniref:formyltransferase family protein n=1 Tax=Streptomyces syringium TaxID=76729 RepID=UPI003AAFC784